jgi:hypothetical protein
MAIAAPGQATPRVGAPASLWVLVAVTLVAALIPAFRRSPRTALPALFATIPWWPLPLPPIALVFTGPLAWLPVIASVGVAIGLAPVRALGRAIGATDRPARATVIAFLATLAIVAGTLWTERDRQISGDEPHYLVITQSLLKDGDLQIENNHQRRDYAPYYGGDLAPHYLVPGLNGKIYSIHAPGLPVLVMPGFALFGYRGAEWTVMLVAALAGALVWRIGWLIARDTSAAWFTWAAIAGATTFVMQSVTIYPDGPAMAAVAAALLLLVRLSDEASAPVGDRLLAAASIGLAALPWLHSRFSVIAAVFDAAIIWRLLRDEARPMGARIGRLMVFCAAPLVCGLWWLGFFQTVYGTPNPAAPYGDTSGPAGTHWQYVPGGFVALIFDGQFGLLTYSPVLIAAVAGWWRPIDRAFRRAGLESLLAVVLYGAAVATYWMWWAGRPAPPARFFAAVLPALAVPLASAWATGDARRRSWLSALVGISLGITAIIVGVNHGALAWNDRDGQSQLLQWLGPLVNLRRAWPSFFWTLDPAVNPHNLGSEWLFARHVAVWIACWLAAWAGWRLLGRARATLTPLDHRLGAAAFVVIGLLFGVQAGWLLNGVSGIDAEPAQAAVILASHSGRAVYMLDAMSVTRLRDLPGRIVIATQEPGKLIDPSAWFVGSSLPAGDYDVRLHLDAPRAGTMTIGIGDQRIEHDVIAAADQAWPIRVEQNASEVVVVAGETLRGTKGTVLLTLK